MDTIEPELAIALLHHPVLNKQGETIGSAVTNLDLHDISRAARTYGVKNYFVATPFEDQLELVREITDHWQNGHGATANPARKEALAMVKAVNGFETVIKEMRSRFNRRLLVVATSARQRPNQMSYEALKIHLNMNRSRVLLLFGTAHGLAPEIMEKADAVLPPIARHADYNHLSVRSAVSIILDRLLGDRDK
ncbi:MAG: RNA methyltransferase [Desulfobulbaceae bacterium]|nr:MAG: RNA methyltransferase [Desulfobulbaceae bacterium]